jgi:hypothetical protein
MLLSLKHIIKTAITNINPSPMQVRAALSGHHLASSLPHLPPKHSKLLHNHADPRFQEQRRQELELWVKKLVNVPYVLEVPMTLPFLGVAQVLILLHDFLVFFLLPPSLFLLFFLGPCNCSHVSSSNR